MIKREPNYHKGKTRLVFAGQEGLNGYQQVGVKFERNKSTQTHLTRNPRLIEIRLPDRTVYIASKALSQSILLDKEVDAVVSTRRDLNQHIEMGTDMLLFNPINAPRAMDTRMYLRNGIDVLVDSGGFQLAQGTSEFVSPDETAAFYTQHASIGMGLDFPAPGFVDRRMYKENCALQRLNNERIRSLIPDSVSLAPVVHGSTPLTRKHCLDQVYKKGRDKTISLAGLISRRADTIEIMKTRIASMALILHLTRKEILYYHALGATSPFMLALYGLLTKTGYVCSIGGDSVSHRQNAIGGSYKLVPYFSGATTLIQPLETNVSARLPCGCPVCVVVGDARILRDYRISEVHHLYASHQHKVSIDDNMSAYVNGKITRTELWKFVLGEGNMGFKMLPNLVFDYFENVIAKGYDKVQPLAPFEGYKAKGSLFNNKDGDDESLTSHQKSVIQRYKTIHKSYEKYHKQKLV